MKHNGVIEKKLRLLETKLQEIESWDIKTFSQLKDNSMLNNALERALQVAVEIMIDVSERILAFENVPPLDKAADNMKELEKLGLIKDSKSYMDMVRFRNFIVHRYEYIDLDILFDIAHNKLHFFRSFVKEIRQCV